jgi:hypothetical protein
MKVNRVYKVVRPMRKFGNLIKDIINPSESKYAWCRYPLYAKTKKQKELYMATIIEHLDNRIEINTELETE